MDTTAFLLVLISAIIHAYWNLLVKMSKDAEIFIWFFLIIITLVFFPFFWISFYKTDILLTGWCCIVMTGLCKTLYFISLSRAYRKDDLSFIYPLVRSTPIIFVTVGSMLFLRENPSIIGMMGIMLIFIGGYCLHIDKLRNFLHPLKIVNAKATQWALLTALFISFYSVIDKIGVTYVETFPYLYLMFAFVLVFFTPYIVVTRPISAIITEWNLNKKNIIIVGFCNFFAYYMILSAMEMDKLSYIVALRETSIIFGVMLGALILKEEHINIRITSSFIIIIGSILIGIAK